MFVNPWDVALHWYIIAQQNDMPEPEAAFKFISYWMSFNFLYSKDNENNSEKKNIINYIMRNKKKMIKFNPMEAKEIAVLFERPVFSSKIEYMYDGKIRIADLSNKPEYYLNFKTDIYSPKTDEDKCSKKNMPPKRLFSPENEMKNAIENYQNLMKYRNNYNDETIKYLILTVYKIRCNLFHGEKEPHPEEKDRDTRLVKAAAYIMEGYMKELLKEPLKDRKDSKSMENLIKSAISEERYNIDKRVDTWGGADVVIAPEMNSEIEKWLTSSSAHVAVISPNAYAVIWLIGFLKNKVNVDYLSKYDYYAKIAKAANTYSDNENIKGMLNYIYENIKEYIKK